MNKFILWISFMTLSVVMFGQNTKKGDKAFEKNEYYKAVNEYTLIEDKITDVPVQSAVYYKIAESYRWMNLPQKAEPYYVKALKAGYVSADIYFGYGEVLLKQAKYGEAKKQFEVFKRSNPENKLVDAKIASCVFAEANKTANPKYKLQPMETINSKGSEYGIAYFNENLIYASTGNPIADAKNRVDISPRTGLPYSKFYMAVAMGGSYSKGELAVGLNKKERINEGTFSYDNVNNVGYYTRCEGSSSNSQCYIYFAKFENNQWKEVGNLKIESRKMPVAHPFVVPDGSRIYFVSSMEGGFGKVDIWYTDKLPDGTWGKPINLGREVNTAGNEYFPFVADGYLFFSSDGHPGYGGLDIFASKIDVNVHGKAVNIGLPFNSSADDMNLIEKHDMSEGMFVSTRRVDNSDDIFRFQGFPSSLIAYGRIYDSVTKVPIQGVSIDVKQGGKTIERLISDEKGEYSLFVDPEELDYELSTTVEKYNPIVRNYTSINERFGVIEGWDLPIVGSEAYLSGIVTGIERQRNGSFTDLGPLAGVKVVLFGNGQQLKITETNFSGEYRFGDIQENARYEVKAIKEGEFFSDSKFTQVGKITQSIDFCKANGYDMDIQLEKIQTVIPVNNILYDLNKATLRPESFDELNKLIDMLQKNKNLKIEIRSHTDSRGSVSYNNKLSQARAKSVVDYLVSRGIDPGKLTPKGYGKSQLLVKKEKTEEDFQLNRRTEFSVIGTTGETLYDTRMDITPSISINDIPIHGEVGQSPYYSNNRQTSYPTTTYPSTQQPTSRQVDQGKPFRVQVFASSKYDLSKPDFQKIKQQFNLDVYVESGNGIYRYYAGGFDTMEAARAMADRMNRALGTQYFPKAR
ncbi:MAG: OmpA family protein [Prevotellaceae bacterium]|jgi:outer membrane protein OmpA-like peptidoglycan-associated protein|nr:OmpA family protein [Prevotellaceae bacterium]